VTLAELSAAKSKLYAIINTAGAGCIRKYVGTAEANDIIEAERNRIEHFRTRTRDLEAAVAQLFVMLPEHREVIQKTVSDCDTRRATTSDQPKEKP
jgi:hypothetical protein